MARRARPLLLRSEPAPGVHARLVRIAAVLDFRHIDPRRLACVRTYGSQANALARISGLPLLFQQALKRRAHYVIEVMMPAFGRLSRAQQDRVLIHELLHIPATFSGGLRSEGSTPLRTHHTVNRLYREFLKNRSASRARRRSGRKQP